jgi:hypothetical protein
MQLTTRALGLLALALTLSAGQARADFIDTFSNTTALAPPGLTLSIAGVQFGAADARNDTGADLGGNRTFGAVFAGAASAGGNLSLSETSQVAGGTFQFSSARTATGSTASAGANGLLYGAASFPSPSSSADPSVPSAFASERFFASANFLADFAGQQGIAVDVASLDAAAVGSVFTLGIADTSLHAAQLSVTVTAPGAQTLLFPFASLVPTGSSGVFFNGVAAPVDLASLSQVALVFEPELGGSFTLDAIRTQGAPTAVPEPSSLALLGLGACGLLGYARRRHKARAAGPGLPQRRHRYASPGRRPAGTGQHPVAECNPDADRWRREQASLRVGGLRRDAAAGTGPQGVEHPQHPGQGPFPTQGTAPREFAARLPCRPRGVQRSFKELTTIKDKPAAGSIRSQAGSTYVAANPLTTLLASGLNYPGGVAVDGWGNVFIADPDNNAIKEWSAQTLVQWAVCVTLR